MDREAWHAPWGPWGHKVGHNWVRTELSLWYFCHMGPTKKGIHVFCYFLAPKCSLVMPIPLPTPHHVPEVSESSLFTQLRGSTDKSATNPGHWHKSDTVCHHKAKSTDSTWVYEKVLKGCCWITWRHRDSWAPEEKNSIQGQRRGLIAQSFCEIKFY